MLFSQGITCLVRFGAREHTLATHPSSGAGPELRNRRGRDPSQLSLVASSGGGGGGNTGNTGTARGGHSPAFRIWRVHDITCF